MELRSSEGATARLAYAVKARAGGGATLTLRTSEVDARGSDSRNLLLHWGVQSRAGGEWWSPYDALRAVPMNSRAPDGKSCESGFRDDGSGEQIVELAIEPRDGDVASVVCLIRTQDCKVWYKHDGRDLVFDLSGAIGAVDSPSRQERRETPERRREAPSAEAPPPAAAAATATATASRTDQSHRRHEFRGAEPVARSRSEITNAQRRRRRT